ncbi:MAG: hypothetical protein Q8K75_00405 [Chlamydiales bacterium]|nr:hypothetical protein [Chlamydiales bacterium]
MVITSASKNPLVDEWNMMVSAPKDLAIYTVKQTKNWAHWVSAGDVQTNLSGFQRLVRSFAEACGVKTSKPGYAEKTITVVQRAAISWAALVGVAASVYVTGKGIEFLGMKIIDNANRPCVEPSGMPGRCLMGNVDSVRMPDLQTTRDKAAYLRGQEIDKVIGACVKFIGTAHQWSGAAMFTTLARPVYWTGVVIPRWTLGTALPAIYDTLAKIPAPEFAASRIKAFVSMTTGQDFPQS